MTGLALLLVVGLWWWASLTLSRIVVRKLPAKPWRRLVGYVVFGLLFALPVADEIVGGFQFRALCKKNAVFHVGVEHPEGRITKFSANSPGEFVHGTFIKIYDAAIEYKDVQSGEVVVKFHSYTAEGGWLIRALGISESDAPLTIGSPFCSPEQERHETVGRTLGFSVIR